MFTFRSPYYQDLNLFRGMIFTYVAVTPQLLEAFFYFAYSVTGDAVGSV